LRKAVKIVKYKTKVWQLWYILINPKKISVMKYKEMLMATVKDALEILGYSSSEKMKS
jgi:hypothetical protein